MDQKTNDPMTHAFAQAQETIARQEKQITLLHQQLEQEKFAQDLRKLLVNAESTMTVIAPFSPSQVLEMVVVTAAQVLSAQAGSLYLIDFEKQDLTFEVAIGPVAKDVKKFRVPLGHGIAGMVGLTGQPLAIADAARDERFAIDIATEVKYIPKSILCVPLFYDDQVIGALELFDKSNADAFGLEDMETLGLFAHIAAVAIAQSRVFNDRQSLLQSLVDISQKAGTEQKQLDLTAFTKFSQWLQREDTFSKTANELAQLLHQLLLQGEQKSLMCKNVLQSFVGVEYGSEREYAHAPLF